MHTQMCNESQQLVSSVTRDPRHHVYRGRVSDLSPELANLIGLDMPAPTKPWNFTGRPPHPPATQVLGCWRLELCLVLTLQPYP